jgi:RNA recognition motif-containing protein
MTNNGNNKDTNQNDWEEAQKQEENEREFERMRKEQEARDRGDDVIDDDDEENGFQREEVMDTTNWIEVGKRIRRYKAIINVKDVTGTNKQQKMNKIQQAIGGLEKFFGIRLHNFNKEQYIMAEFGDKDTMEEACKMQIEENSDFKLKPLLNRGDDEIRNRTLVIRDLPLNVEKETLKRIMERKGKYEVTDIKTQVTGPWIKAHVTFKDPKAIDNFNDIWSIPYLKDFCRIAPATITGEEIEMRNRFTLKLANLPFGITAFDLKQVIEETKAKICFIPRTRDRYARLRFAFLSFEEEDDMKKAAEGDNQYTIKGQRLVWTEPDAKTCHKCGNPAHLIKDCDEKEQSLARKQNLAQFKKVYTRYRVPNYKKINRISYANRGPYYQEEKKIEEQATYEKAPQDTNYTKEQGKGNFDNEAKSMYALLSAIK